MWAGSIDPFYVNFYAQERLITNYRYFCYSSNSTLLIEEQVLVIQDKLSFNGSFFHLNLNNVVQCPNLSINNDADPYKLEA